MDDHDSDEGMEDDQFNDWEEEGGEVTPSKCLYCDQTFVEATEVFSHCENVHHFYIRKVCALWNLDCFGYIKMVNFIRKEVTFILLFYLP